MHIQRDITNAALHKKASTGWLGLFHARSLPCPAMTLHNSNQLSDEVQQAYVYRVGTYLARRWDDFHRAALPYQLPDGFYAELAYDRVENEASSALPSKPAA
jgi:hypothetical protein